MIAKPLGYGNMSMFSGVFSLAGFLLLFLLTGGLLLNGSPVAFVSQDSQHYCCKSNSWKIYPSTSMSNAVEVFLALCKNKCQKQIRMSAYQAKARVQMQSNTIHCVSQQARSLRENTGLHQLTLGPRVYIVYTVVSWSNKGHICRF